MLLTNYLTLCVLDETAGLLGGGLINYLTLWVRLSGVLVAKALVANMWKGTVWERGAQFAIEPKTYRVF